MSHTRSARRDASKQSGEPTLESRPARASILAIARIPEGAQNADNRGSGAGRFDRGVDASQVGAPYHGARPEDPSRATEPGDPVT